MGEVAGAPIHRGADRAHEGRHQGDHDQAQGHRRQELNREQRVALLPVGLIGQQHHRGKRHHDPGPAAQDVVHGQKDPAGGAGFPLIAGGEQTLNEFTAAITAAEAPPLQGQVGTEGGDRNPSPVEPLQPSPLDLPGHQRQQLRPGQTADALQQRIHAAGRMDRSHRDSDGPEQGQNQLQHVRDDHGPESAGRRVDQDQQGDDGQEGHLRLGGGGQAQGLTHLGHGQKGIAQADAVDRQGEQKRLDAPQPGGGGAAVAQFRQGRVGQNPTASPEGSEDDGHGDMGHTEAPPLPVAGETAHAHQPGDVEGRIDREGRGRHRGPRQPTFELTARDEVVRLTGVAAGQPEANEQARHQITDDDRPIDAAHGRPSLQGSLPQLSGNGYAGSRLPSRRRRSWPQAASASKPRLARTLTATCRSIRARRKASTAWGVGRWNSSS